MTTAKKKVAPRKKKETRGVKPGTKRGQYELAKNNADATKERFLEALAKSIGIVKQACLRTDTPRGTFYKYLNEDPIFAQRVEEIQEETLDYVESQLLKNIGGGKEASIIFYLKTKGRKRGYVEKHAAIEDEPAPRIYTEEEIEDQIRVLLGEDPGTTTLKEGEGYTVVK